eukprot:Skav209346  [mRNA]  locus=scaffold241:628128:628738:+ [translate_table: standard]
MKRSLLRPAGASKSIFRSSARLSKAGTSSLSDVPDTTGTPLVEPVPCPCSRPLTRRATPRAAPAAVPRAAARLAARGAPRAPRRAAPSGRWRRRCRRGAAGDGTGLRRLEEAEY